MMKDDIVFAEEFESPGGELGNMSIRLTSWMVAPLFERLAVYIASAPDTECRETKINAIYESLGCKSRVDAEVLYYLALSIDENTQKTESDYGR